MSLHCWFHRTIDRSPRLGIGPAVLLANWTQTNVSNNLFSVDAGSQLDYILNYSPHTADGAISHRADQVQLWYGESPSMTVRYALAVAQ
jgi:hypothetical protein